MNELVFLGGRPIAQRELVRLGNRLVATHFGLGDVGVGVWPGDLLSYRQEWEPFIAAHLALWRHLNDLFEGVPDAKQCPPGIFSASQIQNLNPTMQSFYASLALTRMYTSDTDPSGILTQWNAWKDKSSADVLAAAATMLQWHQDVVLRVGGPYKDDLLKLAKIWNLDIQLPAVPDFSTQQNIIARIEGAYLSTKGVLQIIGYGAADTLKLAGDTAQALAKGLSDTAKAIPKAIASPLTWIGIAAVVALVGGALIVYYRPREARAE